MDDDPVLGEPDSDGAGWDEEGDAGWDTGIRVSAGSGAAECVGGTAGQSGRYPFDVGELQPQLQLRLLQ